MLFFHDCVLQLLTPLTQSGVSMTTRVYLISQHSGTDTTKQLLTTVQQIPSYGILANLLTVLQPADT